MPRIRNYTVDQVRNIVPSCVSYRQVLSKLGLKEAGGNYACIKKLMKENNIDFSHFTHQSSNRGKNFGPKRPIQDYFDNKFSITSYKLRRRLIREGYFEHKCYTCNNKEWLGEPIPLELEHKDGNHANNNLSNLTLICPNCHARTPTYRGKNIGKSSSGGNRTRNQLSVPF